MFPAACQTLNTAGWHVLCLRSHDRLRFAPPIAGKPLHHPVLGLEPHPKWLKRRSHSWAPSPTNTPPRQLYAWPTANVCEKIHQQKSGAQQQKAFFFSKSDGEGATKTYPRDILSKRMYKGLVSLDSKGVWIQAQPMYSTWLPILTYTTRKHPCGSGTSVRDWEMLVTGTVSWLSSFCNELAPVAPALPSHQSSNHSFN